MQFTPMSEKDLPTNLLKKDIYDVEVLEAQDDNSKKTGNDMIKLKVAIWTGDKIRCHLFDYLIESFPAKLRHACDTFGLLSSYETGSLSADHFIGKTGKAKIDIEIDKTGRYADKNVIRDYVCRDAKRFTGKSNDPGPDLSQAPIEEDDLPF